MRAQVGETKKKAHTGKGGIREIKHRERKRERERERRKSSSK
jgi:hypothetical protein